MSAKAATIGPGTDFTKQFSIFTANQVGKLRDLVALLNAQNVNILAVTVLDSTDNSIVRLVTDDPEKARELLTQHQYSFTENDLLVVEFAATTDLNKLMSALLEAEINVNYLYSFIPQPEGKSMIALKMEDNEMAQKVLEQHQFRLLRQADISR